MAIGDRLKGLRLRDRQSLQQVADAIGASKAHIWELENQRSENPSLDLLRKLAGHFRTTVSYIIDDPDGEICRAHDFFRRNKHKLASLDETEIAVIEELRKVRRREDFAKSARLRVHSRHGVCPDEGIPALTPTPHPTAIPGIMLMTPGSIRVKHIPGAGTSASSTRTRNASHPLPRQARPFSGVPVSRTAPSRL